MHWAQVYRLPAVSVRFFNVYGPRARTSGTYGAVFGVFLAQLLAGQPLTIVGDGEQTRDFTFVSDVVDALLTVAESDKIGEIYNVGSGQPVSVNELVRLLGSPPTVHIPKRPGEPDCTWADICKIRSELGWEPKVSFADGVRVMLRKYRLLARRAGVDGIAHRRSDQRLVPLSRASRTSSDVGGRAMEPSVAKLIRAAAGRPTRQAPRDKVRTVDEVAPICRAGPRARQDRRSGARHVRSSASRPCPSSRSRAQARRRAGRHRDGRPFRQQGSGPAGVQRRAARRNAGDARICRLGRDQ